MKMNRQIVRRLKLKGDMDDGYVQADKADLFSMVWKITKDSWVL